MIGTQLDKYELLQKIGEGGMATVWRGRHTTLDREVAVKILHPHISASPRNRKRFAREARAIESLDHDNILKIYDYSGVDSSSCYIVTEYVEGQTIQQLLDARGLLPSEVVAMIGVELTDALDYAHRVGIVHRDLKAENVMIRTDGTVKLMDFGIARFLDESTVTMTGALVGSPAYMSPEQALEQPVDGRSDLFSLGTLLFQTVTGRLPFSGTNPSVILRNIIEGNRPEVLEIQPGVSPQLAAIIERLLQVAVESRYESAAQVKMDLEAALSQLGIGLSAPEWSILSFLTDPDSYELALRIHLDRVLLKLGQQALDEGDHLGAQRMFNRLLAFDPDHPQVLELLSSLHQPRRHARGRATLTLGAAVALLLVAGSWLLLRPEATPVTARAAHPPTDLAVPAGDSSPPEVHMPPPAASDVPARPAVAPTVAEVELPPAEPQAPPTSRPPAVAAAGDATASVATDEAPPPPPPPKPPPLPTPIWRIPPPSSSSWRA